MDDKYKSFLESFTEVLIQYAKEAKLQKDLAIGSRNELFATGYLSGFHRIITLLEQHAEMFDITPKELGLNLNEIDLI